MGRNDRSLFIALVLAVGAAVAVVVLVTAWSGSGPDRHGPYRWHPPETRSEKAAAAITVAYMRALEARRADTACAVATGRAARALDCDGRRRIPSAQGLPPILRAIGAHVAGPSATIAVGVPSNSRLVDLRRDGTGRWRVSFVHEVIAVA
jgi:hypothetical protein